MWSKFSTIGTHFVVYCYDNINTLSKRCIIFGIGVFLFDYCFKKTRLYNWTLKEEYDLFFESYFLTDKGLRGAEFEHNKQLVPVTWPLVNFIEKAESSLDICFYVITASNVVESILNAKKRKIKIRVIIDYYTGLYNNEFARRLLKAGVPLIAKATSQCNSIMHHKFGISDKKILLQSSMNLTQNSAKGTFDNIIITNHKELVFTFQLIFDIMAEQFRSDINLNDIENYKILNDEILFKKYAHDRNEYDTYMKSLRKPRFTLN